MKIKNRCLSRGVSSLSICMFVACNMGYRLADKWRDTVDGFLGTNSYIINEDENAAKFKSDYATADEMMAAAKALAVKEGREGTVIMKNDNGALPLSKDKKVALFGAAAYKPFMQSYGDLKAGNDDKVNLDDALKDAGFTIDKTMSSIYDVILSDYTESSRYGNTTVTYNNGYLTSPGDMTEYKIREVPPEKYTEAKLGNAPSDWRSRIDKENTVGICVFARGAGESNTYKPASALDFDGNATGKDPLALSADELAVVDAAKETCMRVIVLLNTGNAMELGAIASGGEHEVDAIGYIGVINDYQCIGIVDVLSGVANATGALTETYVYNNTSSPALQNFGGDYFEDYQIAEANAQNGYDSRFPETNIANGAGSSFGGGGGNYNGGMYIVEAEGIYVGYNYYETRYYDCVANKNFGGNSDVGSSFGEKWNYADEVVYPFGHGLSYLDYEQNISSVKVDKTEDGYIKAVVSLHNKSDKDGLFSAQLYVNQPYTEYDKANGVEKSAVMFLNSKKAEVKAGERVNVEISVPTKYLASYDYTNAKTYILDEGSYLFTAACGAHNAVNNFLAYRGYSAKDGMIGEGGGAVAEWNNSSFDNTTYSVDNGTSITNVAEDADLNYYLDGCVTYLSRKDWAGTWPKNYNEAKLKIADSPKKDEWIAAMQGKQYIIENSGEEAENVYGKDTGLKFSSEYIGVEQLNNINDDYWSTLVSGISVDQAVGAVVHGGAQSDTLDNVDNPIVVQNEGVNGIKGSISSESEPSRQLKFNVNSQTLLASSFNPDLAYEWGLIEGNSGLHLKKYHVWGTGLTQKRTPYNGRNYEYISEDAMLTNRMGEGILRGCREKGIINGPKHIGFNDQEHNRAGICVYLNEQKLRECDLRGFQGGLEDGEGQAVMVAFNRIGAVNASHHRGMLKNILRDEWGFKGIISTDLASSAYYFNAESMIMATVTQVAEFGGNNSTISSKDGHDDKWQYLSVNAVKNDKKLVEQARENLKYQLFTFADSAVLNISSVRVYPWWETAFKGLKVISLISAGVSLAVWGLCAYAIAIKKEETI